MLYHKRWLTLLSSFPIEILYKIDSIRLENIVFNIFQSTILYDDIYFLYWLFFWLIIILIAPPLITGEFFKNENILDKTIIVVDSFPSMIKTTFIYCFILF